MSTHYISRGDSGPSMAKQLLAPGGGPQPLSGTVYFHYWETLDGVTKKAGTSTVSKTCTVVNAANGDVRVDFLTSDFTTVGKRYIGKFEMVNGATRLTFSNLPNDFVHIEVTEDIADGA